MNKTLIKNTALSASLLLVSSLPAMAALASAEILVIGSPGLSITRLNSQAIGDLYLGRTVRLHTGQYVEVINLPKGHLSRREFSIEILKRDPEQIAAYWAKRVFTGKGFPPAVLSDEGSVIEWVSEQDGRIGYVRPEAINSRSIPVKILYRWNPRDPLR